MPTKSTDKQLAQRLPITTASMVLYQNKGEAFVSYVKTIFVANLTGSAAAFSLWINQGGTSTDNMFALYRSESIAANTTKFIDAQSLGIVLRGSTASLMCSSGTASALNFTCFGTEVEET